MCAEPCRLRFLCDRRRRFLLQDQFSNGDPIGRDLARRVTWLTIIRRYRPRSPLRAASGRTHEAALDPQATSSNADLTTSDELVGRLRCPSCGPTLERSAQHAADVPECVPARETEHTRQHEEPRQNARVRLMQPIQVAATMRTSVSANSPTMSHSGATAPDALTCDHCGAAV